MRRRHAESASSCCHSHPLTLEAAAGYELEADSACTSGGSGRKSVGSPGVLHHPGRMRLADAYTEDPADPDIVATDHPQVLAAIERIAPGTRVEALGGTMSRNLHLVDAGLVLRVHQDFVTRRRVLGERHLKGLTRSAGLAAAEPVPWRGRGTFTVAGRVAELERYAEHTKPSATWESYRWLYTAIGKLHDLWRDADVDLPRPVVSTYGPPGTVRRYLDRIDVDGEAGVELSRIRTLTGRLARRWIPSGRLPTQLLHGDARLGNIARSPDESTLVLDLGFAARRPRVHDLAYSMAWIMLRPDDSGLTSGFDTDAARTVIGAYDAASGQPLSDLEREAFDQYLVAVPLYLSGLAGFMPDPAGHLLTPSRRRLVDISAWVLDHPGAIAG